MNFYNLYDAKWPVTPSGIKLWFSTIFRHKLLFFRRSSSLIFLWLCGFCYTYSLAGRLNVHKFTPNRSVTYRNNSIKLIFYEAF